MKKAFSFNTSKVLLHKNVIIVFSSFCNLFLFHFFKVFFFKLDVSNIFEKVKILDLRKHMKSWILV